MIQIPRKPISKVLRISRTMLFAAAIAPTLAACSATPVARTDGLDPRLAWPCDRLVLVWTVDELRLQQMLGEALEVRRISGAGQLHLHLMRCEPTATAARNAQALSYAYILIPVSGDSAPSRLRAFRPMAGYPCSSRSPARIHVRCLPNWATTRSWLHRTSRFTQRTAAPH